MTKEERAQLREANRIKNERRRKQGKKRTLYAEQGRTYRQLNNGAFGKAEPALFNQLAEGTTAVRRAESNG